MNRHETPREHANRPVGRTLDSTPSQTDRDTLAIATLHSPSSALPASKTMVSPEDFSPDFARTDVNGGRRLRDIEDRVVNEERGNGVSANALKKAAVNKNLEKV
ncbi:hypothetical protein PsorP6_000656 [Peronosclerospora sorghi]|uniref:Uncharacterized protein n=1 Tax=Peronosclerospora sorghi TaxID=230839 RepID=A0ACC0WSN6_9STRA|nr:hypothetical protein PsorP6_000656 [Peronosclerospora sorghi]